MLNKHLANPSQLWLKEDICLILTPSREKKGLKGASGETAYERLGILFDEVYEFERDIGQLDIPGIIDAPRMPETVQRSRITLV